MYPEITQNVRRKLQELGEQANAASARGLSPT